MSRDRLDNGDCGQFDPFAGQKMAEESRIKAAQTQAIQGANCGIGCPAPRPSARAIIEERIHYHNRAANDLCALLRALPQDISYEAENALFSLVVDSIRR